MQLLELLENGVELVLGNADTGVVRCARSVDCARRYGIRCGRRAKADCIADGAGW